MTLTALTFAAALAVAPMAARAQEDKGPPIMRDAEIEQLLREYTRPILRAAGLEKQNIQIVIINDPRSTPSLPTAGASSSTTAR